MEKMKIVNLSQRSDEWLQWRSRGITASDIPIILGLSPYKTPWQLWAEKIGRINAPDISQNPNVKRGVQLEDEARQLAETRHGEVLLPICGECAKFNVLRASFDGLNSQLVPHEFKAPSDSVWADLEEKGRESDTFKLYESQTQAQCTVSGSTSGRLMFYLEDGRDMEFDITLTPEREAEIIQAANNFWELIVTAMPPPMDPEKDWYIPEPGEARFKWDSYAELWRANQLRVKQLKEQLANFSTEQKDLQRQMIALMGPFMQADNSGVKVSRFSKRGSINYAKFLKDKFPDQEFEAELESYRAASRDESRFTMSEDELVNTEAHEVITSVKASYF